MRAASTYASTAVPLDPSIFKAYDIRGLYGSQIDGDAAEQIGRAFARVLSGLAGKPTSALAVALGHDMRLSAPELSARYRDGLVSEGVHVLDAGQVATEVVYYLVGVARARRRARLHRLAQPQGATPAPSSCARARWRSRATAASTTSAT